MQANEFTRKVLNKKIDNKYKVINFLEEEDFHGENRTFYHADFLYKDTIVYACFVQYQGQDTSIDDMVKEISEEIKNFEDEMKRDVERCMDYLYQKIECRYCDTVFGEGTSKELHWADWETKLLNYLEEKKINMSKDYSTFEIYSHCANNFFKDIIEKKLNEEIFG